MKINEDTPRVLWDNTKHTKIHSHYWGPRRIREKGPEEIFEEIIAEKFLITGKEANRVPGRIDPRRNRPRHILIKFTKWYFPGGPRTKTPRSQCRGPRLDPSSGN